MKMIAIKYIRITDKMETMNIKKTVKDVNGKQSDQQQWNERIETNK